MEETLPGAPTDESRGERVVLHVDMDCFYASCERLKEPDLAGEPIVVGMGYEPGDTIGAVATASYEAREFGVESAQPISKALERLPRVADADPDDPDAPDPAEAGHYRPVDMAFYKEVAGDVKSALHDLADTVREVSIDEAYLDVTDRTSWNTGEGAGDAPLAEGFARHVRERIEREAGVSASVGVAPNMATAKVASDYDKPEGLTVVEPGEVADFLAPLPVSDIHGVGPVTAGDLADMGIETAGDLADADPAELEARFGSRGREFHERANGRDDREVTPTGRPKSLSRESAGRTADAETQRERVRALAADVAERARSRGAMYRTIGVKVVCPPFDVNTRADSLPGPVDDPDLVEEVALDLLEEFAGETVRKLGVRVSNLSFAAEEQATLGGYEGAAPASAADSEEDRDDDRGADADANADSDAEANADAAGDADADDVTRRSADGDATLDEWADEGDPDAERERRRRRRRGQVDLGEFG
ncbi:DNA polymerase IV [Halobaculum magnesiiphilum]|uniref:DNA polymerase IV n=1 Tax=Halobaculum magnesiiphilum TaxID=1017351 RepID=A0A8T8WE59_9EURY|nr:DNA polymerase IV [Halobaculum magnesiiphilum]QZP38157.1 DNA polymerase IV [Halobaculum magnesiiphilum]